MASPLGIDLGNVYRTAEAIKLSQFSRGQQEKAAASNAAAQDAAARFAGGDTAAFGELVALNPDMASKVVASFNALDDAGRKAKQQEVDQIGQIASGILSAKDPAGAYAQLLNGLEPDIKAKFPASYNEDWVKAQLAQATEIDKIYETIQGEATHARDRTEKAADTATEQTNALARIEATGNQNIRVAAAKDAATGGGQIESADSALLFRQAGELLGGLFDQEGNLQNLDPDTRSKVQEIATRASKYFAEGKSHAEAVKMAAKELGITFPGDTPPDNVMTTPTAPTNPDDPAGLFN